METISLLYPTWYLLFCFLGGIIYALFLYGRNKDFEDKPRFIKSTMGGLRFISIAGIIFLLLQPIIKSSIETIVKPIILLARDNSSSMLSGFANDEEKNEFQSKYEALVSKLSQDYDVRSYAFGINNYPDTAWDYNQNETNISALINSLYDQHNHENIGAIILASDGIYNKGNNPLYSGTQMTAPMYVIAVGDTMDKKDVSILDIFHNEVVYLNDEFVINIDIAASFYQNEKLKVEVIHHLDGQKMVIASQEVLISDLHFFTSIQVTVPATTTGINQYSIRINPLEGEHDLTNNQRQFYINVLDAKQRIKIIALSPHPDLGVIKTSLEKRKNNIVDIEYISNEQIDLSETDLVILHQLPGNRYAIQNLLKRLNDKKIPRWFILGAQSNISLFNKAQSALTIDVSSRQTNEVTATINPQFKSYLLSENFKRNIPLYPPLTGLFANFNISPSAQVVLTQRILNVQTSNPLLLIQDQAGIKTSVLTAEGIWKWRLFNNLQFEQYPDLDEFVQSMIRYLSVKDDKRLFRVKPIRQQFSENESVLFFAESYNKSFELDNSEDVTMDILDENNSKYPYTFSKKDNIYELNAGRFDPGKYRFSAITKLNGKEKQSTGSFTIKKVELEAYRLKADYGLLSSLAQKNGGSMTSWKNMETLYDRVHQNNHIKPIVYQQISTRPLIDFKWPFVLLFTILALEWFMRRYHGKY